MAQKNKFLNGIPMPAIDDFFSSEAERQDEQLEKVQMLSLDKLFPFKDHPFEVRNDDEMAKMVESVQENGIVTPILVRPREEGGYEIVSGHRRSFAAEQAGLQEIPCIIRDMDRDAAIVFMVDANLQREHVRPMEKARAFKMKMEAIKRQGRRSDLTSVQLAPKLSAEVIGDTAGVSKDTVKRFIRLNNLVPELQELVDEGRLKFNPAVELSYLKPTEQQLFADYIENEQSTPSLSQAQHLKAASKSGTFNSIKLREVMTSQVNGSVEKPLQLSLSYDKFAGYFPKGFSRMQIEDQITKILEAHFRQLQIDSQELDR